MKVTKKLIQTLVQRGVEDDVHHATLKKEIREIQGEDAVPTTEQQTEIRERIAAFDPADLPEPATEEDAFAYIQEMKDTNQGGDGRWNRVVRPTEWNEDGVVTRVVIRCVDPQETSDGESVCEEEREIAVQDLFQVMRCQACQDRAVQLYRNRRARERRKEKREAEAA